MDDNKDTRLKLAVQKSGRLTDSSLDLLNRCGLKLSRGKDQLMGFGENMPLDVLFVRDDDDCFTRAGQFVKQTEHSGAGLRIEIAGGFIR